MRIISFKIGRNRQKKVIKLNELKFTKVIYISHPFGGDKKNLDEVENIIVKARETYPNYLFISPCHSFSFLYNKTDYEVGLSMCLYLLQCCDECWIYGDWQNSRGCKTENEFCKEHGIKIRFMTENNNIGG